MNALGISPGLQEFQFGGRKGKTCSMSGCYNTHQRCPSMSFFRFPKEVSRAKEWLIVCERPDLIRRIDLGDININNFYICEIHFPNQILDYATRKILIKTAQPLSMAEIKLLPLQSTAGFMMNNSFNGGMLKQDGYSGGDFSGQENDDDFDEDYNENDDGGNDQNFSNTLIPQVIIAKAEGNYQPDLLEPISIQDEDSYAMEDSMSRNALYWTAEATRFLIKLRAERESDFEQSGARKSQLWIEICNKMREAGYDFTPEKVSKKWHNIMITYNKNTEKKASQVNWEFFEDIQAIYQNRQIQDDSSSSFGCVNPVPLDRLRNDPMKMNGNGYDGPMNSKRRHAQSPSIDERSSIASEPLDQQRPLTREFKRRKIALEDGISLDMDNGAAHFPGQSGSMGIDEQWWKNYFERKLDLERERMRKEDARHADRMNFQKMAIMLQEKVEKIKVDAMNNLTNALLRLQESRI